MSDYSAIWDTIQSYGFKRFTQFWYLYVLALVHELYEAYEMALLKKTKGTIWNSLEEVEVDGVIVPCSARKINTSRYQIWYLQDPI